MKKSLFYSLFIIASHYGFAQYVTHADAFDSTSDEYCKCITITPNDNYKAGSFWNEMPLDLSESFEIIVKPIFGCITESAEGGDGIAFLI